MISEIVIIRIILAGVIGFFIGLSYKRMTTARLFSIVCMGSALVTHISAKYFITVSMTWYSDPGRLSAQIIAALGFIGSGLIWISQDKKIEGLSAAAGLWLTAIIGMAIGSGLTSVSIGTIIFLLILYVGYTIRSKISRS